MQIFDIWAALLQDKEAVIFALAWIGWGSIMLFTILRSIWGNRLGFLESILLAMGGSVLPIFLAVIPIFALGAFLGLHITPVVLLALIFFTAGVALRATRQTQRGAKHVPWLSLLIGGILLLSVSLRLLFVTKILFPSYFDSAEHYRIINILIRDYENASRTANFISPVASYYHLGYHLITAVMTAIAGVNLERMMLVFGQIILAFAPFPLFFIVRRETRSDLAGFFAVFLGIFGWYMPAHAANWGKYPALLGLLTIQFALGILYLVNEQKEKTLKFRADFVLAALSICVSLLIHTRSIILIGIAIVSWKLVEKWEGLSKAVRSLFGGLVLTGLTAEIAYIERTDIFTPLLDPYLHEGIWVTGAVVVLSILACSKHKHIVFTCLLFMLFALSSLFIPVSSNTFFTLLDRPMIEMVLFIPLSILGGTGFASLGELAYPRFQWLKIIAAILVSGFVVFHAFARYSFYPSDCCVLIGNDDLLALDWMDERLPHNARILISSSEIRISPSGQSPQNTGADAGIWIAPLIDRPTVSLPYPSDFRQVDVLNRLCEQKITHIYAGSTNQSFNLEFLSARPDWYKNLLYLPDAQVYQVNGCRQ